MSAACSLSARGVHRAVYLIDGLPVLHAIDHRGNLVRRVKIRPDDDEEIARVWLEGLLEHVDPAIPTRPQLTLLRPTASSAHIHPAAALWQLSRRARAVSGAPAPRGLARHASGATPAR